MKIVAICQARMASTRLPGKMLLPLAGAPMVQRVLERVRRAEKVDKVVLAYPGTDHLAFYPTVKLFYQGFTEKQCVEFFLHYGDENDLVGRYLSAAKASGADLIVRVPCDNPCVQPEYIDEAITRYLALPRVFVSTTVMCWKDHLYIDGLGAEVFSLSRLKWLDQATKGQPNYREHPHLLFQDQQLIEAWEQYQRHANHRETIRLDVNTQADYDFIADIYDHCYPTNPHFTIKDILAYLETKTVPA